VNDREGSRMVPVLASEAAAGEEDARAFVARDGRTLVFNKRHGKSIDILSLALPS
jgi:hypothetical protein